MCFFVKQPLHKVLRYRIRVEVTSTAVSYFVSFTSARVYFNPCFAIVFAHLNIAHSRILITGCIDSLLTCVHAPEVGKSLVHSNTTLTFSWDA